MCNSVVINVLPKTAHTEPVTFIEKQFTKRKKHQKYKLI